MRSLILFVASCLCATGGAFSAGGERDQVQTVTSETGTSVALLEPHISTFSIVARDPETGDYGVAVQSRYFAVGEVVPHAIADVGAVATQARANLLYGPQGLSLMAEGITAGQVIERLLANDPLRDERQVGLVDRNGTPASYTGDSCLPWAGSRLGLNYAAQGNLLAGPQVVDAMAAVYEASQGDFAQRLIDALAAGQAAGGDARGRQSAALLVVREGGGYLGLTDRLIDLHVEDHATPIRELSRLLRIRQSQLAGEQARRLLFLVDSNREDHAGRIGQARELVLNALEQHPSDDDNWWLLAQIYQLEGRTAQAVTAAQRALLENPTWRWLSPTTRQSLGVPAALIDELLQTESFSRVWASLAPPQQALSP